MAKRKTDKAGEQPGAGMTIRLACDVRDFLPLDELLAFQGELKILSETAYIQLKTEILETGFAFPVHFWKSPKGECFIVGGHQRVLTLKRLRDVDGFRVPRIPVVRVLADDLRQAKRRVLQDIAQYGQVTADGLVPFMDEAGFDMKDIAGSFRIPDINLEFLAKAVDFEPPKKVEFLAKGKSQAASENNHAHECPRCGHQFD